MRKILGSYINGNTFVIMYPDGTKERYIKDGEVPMPEFPESIDLKITNRCNMRCKMCAEQSTPRGEHANLNNPLLNSLQPYTELAIGGGNPLEHPGLHALLVRMKYQRVICNLTVNVRHFMDYKYMLMGLADQNLIHGLGVSVPNDIPYSDEFFKAIKKFPNAVIHTIAGYTPQYIFEDLKDHNLNLLILGYKTKGLGVEYYATHYHIVDDMLIELAQTLPDLRNHFKAIAFDNLAVKQLCLSSIISKEEYNNFYMGDDGEYTMYVDLVTNKFGKSSTHSLSDINSYSISELFGQLYEKEHCLWE
jgi:hypothetical protein